jgi:hypothetical protein
MRHIKFSVIPKSEKIMINFEMLTFPILDEEIHFDEDSKKEDE